MNRPIWTLARKDLTTFLNAPATYIVFVLFLLLTGYLFIAPLFQMNLSSLDTFLRPMPFLMAFLVPALTMRSFAEEFREGTMEYLSTLPIRDYEIVLGKFAASLGLIAALFAFTLAYPLVLVLVGRPDAGEMAGGYLALAGLTAFFTSIGLWASSLTRNQVVAFIIAFFVCFFFVLLERLADFAPAVAAGFIRGLCVTTHYEAMSRGVIDTRDLLYWLSGTFFFLSACLAAVHSRRWR
jgi:ABC-2 type transport system permease protein